MNTLADILRQRFGEDIATGDPALDSHPGLLAMAGRRVCRAYADRPVAPDLVRTLCAVALSSPTKSDLQQRDIVVLQDAEQRRRITSLLNDPWIEGAPLFLVFCGNNRRQRQIAAWRDKPFPNDHLDAFFNATVDAAIALAAFTAAAESVGLGICPISVIRDHAETVSKILALPPHVFPVAGMTLGWPKAEGQMSLRLPLAVTVHRDRFQETDAREQIDAYDRRRAAAQPYRRQRHADEFGTAAFYGWSEDKARQYSKAQRADFGAFVRRKGFDLR